MTAVCSWCSTEIPEGATACPSCGANLVPDGDPNVPGVTAVDAASIIRSRSAPPQRGRFMAWISGESATELPSKAEQEAIAPPADDVRREMLRIALQAEVANLQAEADALRAEAVAEGRLLDAAIAPVEVAADAPGAAADGAEAGAVPGDVAAEATADGAEAGAVLGDVAAEATAEAGAGDDGAEAPEARAEAGAGDHAADAAEAPEATAEAGAVRGDVAADGAVAEQREP